MGRFHNGGKTKSAVRLLSCLLVSGFLLAATAAAARKGPEKCLSCHKYELDAAHRFACARCHSGNPDASVAEKAHQGMIARPAHPDRMAEVCGPCHQQVHAVRKTVHFTLAKEINLVRRALGAEKVLAGPKELLAAKPDSALLALGDDMLRRRCLRCHLYYPGDEYEATRGGTGCAACHLLYEDRQLLSHKFVKMPPDEVCLRCHRDNFVGADYYGRFDHDFNAEYRTPLNAEGISPRPYGIEHHQLAVDVHRRAGMACIDCHSGTELMGTAGKHAEMKKVACEDCHSMGGKPVALVSRLTGKKLLAPAIREKNHRGFVGRVDCAVCHAQWSYDDEGTHLIRLDVMDFDPWAELTVQGSYEAEMELEDAIYGDPPFDRPFMDDTFTGDRKLGLWLKGFGQRRWEKLEFCSDESGRLRVCRPLLDLHLSYVDEDGEVVFDSQPIVRREMGLLPYAPHTIGKAGLFYRRRLPEGWGEAKGSTAKPPKVEPKKE